MHGLERFWLAILLLLVLPAAQAATDQKAELEKLKTRIDKIHREIKRDVARRDETLAQLANSETLIQTLNKNVAALKVQRESSESRLAALKRQQAEREARLAADKSGLAEQVRTAFISGRHAQLKMLFNQEDPATAGRMSVYYRYFGEARAAQIRAVVAALEELRTTTNEVATETDNLKRLEKQRETELAALKSARIERKTLVTNINARIKSQGSEASRLEAQQSRLQKLIEELERVLKEFPVDSREAFSRLKGRLAWPVKGRLLADFGQPRAGRGIKWNGVLVGAARGSAVRAIARARVAFADWLPGLGLLVVLEHSDGYISLYGHNETLTCEAGDWLNAGDTLATVGDSGGQAQPALYFEIRRGKSPVNPHRWFGRRL